MLKNCIVILNKFFTAVGILCAILMFLTVLNIVFDVVMRYAFNDVSIALQELEWHLFSAMFLLGISYGLNSDTHVRVDFLYEKFPAKVQSMINVFGVLLFIFPLAILIIYYSFGFAYDAFLIGEQSGDPGGLTNRWIAKSLIPIAFILVIVAGLKMLCENLNIVLHNYGSTKMKAYLCFDIENK